MHSFLAVYISTRSHSLSSDSLYIQSNLLLCYRYEVHSEYVGNIDHSCIMLIFVFIFMLIVVSRVDSSMYQCSRRTTLFSATQHTATHSTPLHTPLRSTLHTFNLIFQVFVSGGGRGRCTTLRCRYFCLH